MDREANQDIGDRVEAAGAIDPVERIGSYSAVMEQLHETYKHLDLTICSSWSQRHLDFPRYYQILALGHQVATIYGGQKEATNGKVIDIDMAGVQRATRWKLWKRRKLVAMVNECHQRLYTDRMSDS